MKESILISACLLGEKCRYDGESKIAPKVIALSEKYNLIAVCPEVLGGLKTPRVPCEIAGSRVLGKDKTDKTAEYMRGAKAALRLAKENNCKTAILKSKSPSCGKGLIYDGTFSGKLKVGDGVTAKLLTENGIRVLTEEEI